MVLNTTFNNILVIQSVCGVLTFLKEFLTFFVKDRYQLNYFICIEDFNAQTITSLKLNLFSFFIYCCQQHERKTITFHQNHVIWQMKIKNFWRNRNDSKQAYWIYLIKIMTSYHYIINGHHLEITKLKTFFQVLY
jgi:hypothetical protein